MREINPRVSVVIPVYNTSRMRLERCIESILKQTYQLFEVIVIDDGSTQANLEATKEICMRDPRIKLYIQDNQGSGAARSLGIHKAKSDYILFLDSDDMLSEFALEDAMHSLGDANIDMVVGQIHKEREKDWKNTFFEREPPEFINISTEKDIEEYINHILGHESEKFLRDDRYFCDGPVAKLCRRDLLLKCEFDTQKFWSEDTIWNLRYTKLCRNIVISNNIWYYAFANSDSLTHVFRPNCEYEFKYRIQQEQEIISELWPNCKDGLYVQIWLSTHYIFACYLLHDENKDSFAQKYRMFLRCIREPAYQDMLSNINFKYEEVTYKRLGKKAIKLFCRYGPGILAYMGWKLILGTRHGER